MSESLNHHETEQIIDSSNEKLLPAENMGEHLLESGELEADKDSKIESARETIQESSSETKTEDVLEKIYSADNEDDITSRNHVGQELQSAALNRELKNIQHKENRSQRVLSKIIHQPVIRIISGTAAQTVTRPSGMLGGGILALIGVSSYYIYAKHYGLTYNYSVFILFFLGGFILGVMIELAVNFVANPKRRSTDKL